MSELFSAAAAVARIPGVEPAKATWHSIGGGLSNRTYLVQADERKLILRMDGPQAETLGLDRRTEVAVVREAAAHGIAPDLVFSDEDAGILVFEHLTGRAWTAEDLTDSGKLEMLCELLRKVHALPRSGVAFDAPGAAERYVELIRGDTDLHAFGLRCRDIIAGIPRSPVTTCCHNDVVAANVIESGSLRLVDWEYACDNEPLFDLATLIAYHDLNEAQAAALLRAYTGNGDREDRERLDIERRRFDALQWLWFAVRQMLIPSEPQRDRLEYLARRIRSGH